MKRFLSILLSVIIVCGCLICFPQLEASAVTTPPAIADSEVYSKIYKLYEILGEGSYFTTSHSSSCGSKSSGHACSYCKLSSIISKTWFIDKFNLLSVSQFPVTYYSDGRAHGPDGWSCFGFASFAEWYVFHTQQTDKVTTNYVGTYTYNYTNATNYIKTGDLIRLDDGHSAIAISCDSTGVKVLDSNWSGKNNCQVYIHTIKYASYNKVSVSRATNSYASSANTNSTSTNPDDYTYPSETIYYTSPTMKGATVYWVQAVLYQLGYAIDVDGSYGKNSEAVVKQFQKDYGLEVDGRVGPATRGKLLELWNAKKSQIHTCDKNSFFYQLSHPHYLVYKCSVCGEEQIDTTKTQRLDSCNSCLPEKSVLTVMPGTSTEQTTFTWKSAGGADCYELIVYKNGEEKPVQWLYNLITNQYQLQLDAGDYRAYVVSINNDLIDSSCWWVYSDKVEFSVLQGEVIDNHTHSYHRTNYTPSSCTEYGYTEYLCDCGDSYIEYETELGEHSNSHRVLGEQAESGVNFEYELCSECNHIMCFSVVYPDGLIVALPLPENTEFSDCVIELHKMRNDILGDFGLRAGLSTEDEKSLELSWGAADETDSTEDELGYYELLIYNGNDFAQRIKTATSDCLWEFEPEWQRYTAIITKFNNAGDIVAISCAYSVEIFAIQVDWWGYYGDVDLNGNINIKDATLIQKYLANITTLDKYPLKQADVNSDGKVNIKDATIIQKYCAGLDAESRIGNEFWSGYTEYSGVSAEPMYE